MVLLGCYRKGDAADPEVYTRAIMATLARYPADVVRRVTDPLTGLPSTSNFLPTVAEVIKGCEEIHGPARRAAEWDERTKRQLAEREERDRELAAPRVDLKIKYGETYGLDPAPPKPEADANRTAMLNRMASYSRQCIEREYAARGMEPRTAGDLVISLSLVKSLSRLAGTAR